MQEPKPVHSERLMNHYRDNENILQGAFAKLKNMYGLVDGSPPLSPRTLPEYLFRKYQLGQQVPEGQQGTFYNSMEALHVVDTARSIRAAVAILNDEFGVDVLSDRHALSDKAKYKSVLEALNGKVGKHNAASRVLQPEDMGYVFAADIAHLFGSNNRTYVTAMQNTRKIFDSPQAHMPSYAMATAQISFYETIVSSTISSVRYDAQKGLKEICQDDVAALIDFSDEVVLENRPSVASEENSTAAEILESQKQVLDYTIFPPGTELREVAESIVEGSSEYTKAHIDLERLMVLERVRQIMGSDRCYLMRGKSTGKEMTDEDGGLISEDYIGLIIQHHDDFGNVVGEDCLAVSPIAGKHAGYVVRQDASEGISWREILALSKQDAMAFNARRLRFDPVAGENKYDAYVRKVEALLKCDKSEFGREYILRRDKDGEYGLVHRGRPLGAIALRADALNPSSSL